MRGLANHFKKLVGRRAVFVIHVVALVGLIVQPFVPFLPGTPAVEKAKAANGTMNYTKETVFRNADFQDTHLSQATNAEKTQNFSTAATLRFEAITSTTSDIHHPMIKVDLNGKIPANATDVQAELVTYINSNPTPGINGYDPVNWQRVTKSGFNPSTATWNTYDGSNAWSNAGGDFDASMSAAPMVLTRLYNSTDTAFTNATEPRLVANVSTYVRDAMANRGGLLLMGTKGCSPKSQISPQCPGVFASSESTAGGATLVNSMRPFLRVVYKIPTMASDCRMDIMMAIDNSPSMKNPVGTGFNSVSRFEVARTATLNVVKKFYDINEKLKLAAPSNQTWATEIGITLINNAVTATPNVPLTSDLRPGSAIDNYLGNLTPSNTTGTKIGAAINTVINNGFTGGINPNRKVLIVLSDGKETGTVPTLRASDLAKANDIEIFTVSIETIVGMKIVSSGYVPPTPGGEVPLHFNYTANGDDVDQIFQSITDRVCIPPTPPGTCDSLSIQSFTTPSSTYYPNDAVQLTAKVRNSSTTFAPKVRLNMTPDSRLTFTGNSPTSGVTRIAPDYTFETDLPQATSSGPSTSTFAFNFTVNPTATGGVTIPLNVNLVTTDASNVTTVTNCAVAYVGFIIQHYSVSAGLTTSGTPTDICDVVAGSDSVVVTGSLTNDGPTDLSGKQFTFAITSPTLTVSTTVPAATVTNSNGQTVVTWNVSPANFRSGTVLKFAVTYSGLPSGNISFNGTGNMTDPVMAQYDSTPTNNSADKCLNVSQVSILKYWSDTGTTEDRTLVPGSTVYYLVTATNNATTGNAPITIIDKPSIPCDPAFPASCTNPSPTWDNTLKWIYTNGGSVAADQSVKWAQVTLAPGESISYPLHANVATNANIAAADAQYGTQRCNSAYAQDSNGVNVASTNMCWHYSDQGDLSLTKKIKNASNSLVNTATVQQGTIGTFSITGKNGGPNAALNVTMTDQATATPTNPSATGTMMKWYAPSIPAGVTADDGSLSLTGWPYKTMAFNDTRTIEPQIVVPCDAPLGNITNIATLASANDSNTSNNTNTNTVTAQVRAGFYNLVMSQPTLTPTQASVGDPAKNKVTMSFTLSNTGATVTVPVPFVSTTAAIPSQFSVVANTIMIDGQPAGSVQNGQVVWNTIPTIAIGGQVQLSVTYQVNDNATVVTPAATAKVDAAAISAGATCGKDTKTVAFPIDASTFTKEKNVIDTAGNVLSSLAITETDQAIFQLKVTNTSLQSDFSRPAGQGKQIVDPIDSRLSYVAGSGTCQYFPAGSTTSTACPSGLSITPTQAGNNLTWDIDKLPSRSTVLYQFKVKPNNSFIAGDCPDSIYNAQATLKDKQYVGNGEPFNVAWLDIYPSRCLKGNLHARNDLSSSTEGIKINSPLTVIDTNSILSAKGTVVCPPNSSCELVSYRVGGYNTQGVSSVGLDFDKVVKRMYRNIQRIIRQASSDTIGRKIDANNWQIDPSSAPLNLLGGASLAQFPEGRVWIVNGNLTIDTGTAGGSGVIFKNKGTIIVKGNLNIVGSGTITYETSSPKNAVGFIVLPRDGSTGGDITIDQNVTKVYGAYYAPGTNSDTITNGHGGTVTFAGDANSPQIRPAKGLFIARLFAFNRARTVLEYDSLLNTAEGAPPGFTFLTSPSSTNEGS